MSPCKIEKKRETHLDPEFSVFIESVRGGFEWGFKESDDLLGVLRGTWVLDLYVFDRTKWGETPQEEEYESLGVSERRWGEMVNSSPVVVLPDEDKYPPS